MAGPTEGVGALQALLQSRPETEQEVHTLLIVAAEMAQVIGMRNLRADDPHLLSTRMASLQAEFDGGHCRRMFALDYLPGGRVRVSLSLVGPVAGNEEWVELFAQEIAGVPSMAPDSGHA